MIRVTDMLTYPGATVLVIFANAAFAQMNGCRGGGGGGTMAVYSSFPPGDRCGAIDGCDSPASFVAPLPIPVVIDATSGDSSRITASKGCQQVFHDAHGNPCGSETEVWGYGGSWPGPVVRAKKGIPCSITYFNDLGEDYETKEIKITTHHHGLKIHSAHDGHAAPDVVEDPSFALDPLGLIHPGSEFTYRIPNEQEPGTHWFHDHTMHKTSRNVIMGLAGLFLIEPNDETLYDNVRDLPSDVYEIPLAFQDRKFTPNNQFDYPMNHDELLASDLVCSGGYFGDRMMVNGVHAPFLEVKATWYRFRLLNGCDARELLLDVRDEHGTQRSIMHQIGTEGGFISARKRRTDIYMAPGERYDFLFDFSGFEMNTILYLQNQHEQLPSISSVMQFRVVQKVPVPNMPSSLVSYTFPSNPDKRRRFDLLNPGRAGGAWSIEGFRYDPTLASFQVRQGDTESWTFIGGMMHPHPMHVHLIQYHIDGLVKGSLEDGWKDTFMVLPGESRSFTATFDGSPGIYMFHCHNLEHEDWDMMIQYQVCDDSEEFPCDDNLLGAFTTIQGGGGGGGGMGG